ncbi:MAG: hypothetical protein FJY77_05265 [Candidatus Altiarchaeales archaeon]|nr:hypothetical protein [Candidatus Altiarchaeales archaeon]
MAKVKLTGWKQKRPFVIQAPEKFDFKELGTTVAADPKLLVGRTLGVSLAELTSDRAKQHLMLVFEIHEVTGDKAQTRFKKFMIHSGYLKSKIRKGMDKIDHQSDLSLPDSKIRMKLTVLTPQKISLPKRRDITSNIARVLSKYRESKLEEFVQHVLFGKLGTDIYRRIKKICPISRVEVVEIKKV